MTQIKEQKIANRSRRLLSAGTGGKPLWDSAEAYQQRAAAFNALQQPLAQPVSRAILAVRVAAV
jgi:hypothetical protein